MQMSSNDFYFSLNLVSVELLKTTETDHWENLEFGSFYCFYHMELTIQAVQIKT